MSRSLFVLHSTAERRESSTLKFLVGLAGVALTPFGVAMAMIAFSSSSHGTPWVCHLLASLDLRTLTNFLKALWAILPLSYITSLMRLRKTTAVDFHFSATR